MLLSKALTHSLEVNEVNPRIGTPTGLISSLEKFYSGNLSQIATVEVDWKYSNSETTINV